MTVKLEGLRAETAVDLRIAQPWGQLLHVGRKSHQISLRALTFQDDGLVQAAWYANYEGYAVDGAFWFQDGRIHLQTDNTELAWPWPGEGAVNCVATIHDDVEYLSLWLEDCRSTVDGLPIDNQIFYSGPVDAPK